jgi:hypothetical protein
VKLSSRERVPFLKVVDIWEHRKVLSSTFLQKLRDLWNGPGGESKKVSGVSESQSPVIGKDSFRSVDPKLGDPIEIGSRLARQMSVTAKLLDDLSSCLPPDEGLRAARNEHSDLGDPEILKRVLTSLCAEVNVRNN